MEYLTLSPMGAGKRVSPLESLLTPVLNFPTVLPGLALIVKEFMGAQAHLTARRKVIAIVSEV